MVEKGPQNNTESADKTDVEKEPKLPNVLLIVRCFVRKGEEILILHRTEERKYNPGKWELPGGKLEEWDDLERAVEKEALEETGLYVKIISPDVFTDGKIVKHSAYTGMLYLELVFESRLIGGKISLSSDHSEYKWVTPEDALDYDLSLESRKAIAYYLGRETLNHT